MGKMDGVRVRFEHHRENPESSDKNDASDSAVTGDADNQAAWGSLGEVPYNNTDTTDTMEETSKEDILQNESSTQVDEEDQERTYPVADYIKRQYNVGGVNRSSTPEKPAKEPTPTTAEDIAKLNDIEGPDHIPTTEDMSNLYSAAEPKSESLAPKDTENLERIDHDIQDNIAQTIKDNQLSDDWLKQYTRIPDDNPSLDPVQPIDQEPVDPSLDEDSESDLDDDDFAEEDLDEDEDFEEDEDESFDEEDDDAADKKEDLDMAESETNRAEKSESERRLELTSNLFNTLQKMADSNYLTPEQLGKIVDIIIGNDKNTEPKAKATSTEEMPDLPPILDADSHEHDSTQAEKQKTETLRSRGRKVLSPLVAAGLRRAQHARVETFDDKYVHTSSEPLGAILTDESDNEAQPESNESGAEGTSGQSEKAQSEKVRTAEQKMQHYNEINDKIDEALRNKDKLSSRELYRKYTLISDEIDDSINRREPNSPNYIKTDKTIQIPAERIEELKREAQAKAREEAEAKAREEAEAKEKEAEESEEPTAEESSDIAG